ncbi:uncharacterized protein HKW66_Vig0088070 [Vigna angularis]|uniref:Uncharacterized protein n=1 Tax=Phaseolus angularis TaxID=3914 RepID=A0A8T0KI74_PHAAN|nr:uncharacterized protein HKW66_Vig0088070 [Vigna angularis]
MQNPHQHLPHSYDPPPSLRLGFHLDTTTFAPTFHLDLATLRRLSRKPLILVLSVYNDPMDPAGCAMPSCCAGFISSLTPPLPSLTPIPSTTGGGRGKEREEGRMDGEGVGARFCRSKEEKMTKAFSLEF